MLVTFLYSFWSVGQQKKYEISILSQEHESFLQDIVKRHDFAPVKRIPLNLGISSKLHWLKLELKDSTELDQYMTVGGPTTNSVLFNSYSKTESRWTLQRGGELYSYAQSTLYNVTPSFSLEDVDWSYPVYVLISSKNESLVIPIKTYTTQGYYSSIIQRNSSHNFLYGFLTLVVLINTVWFFISKDQATKYFAINMFLFILFIGYIDGYLQKNVFTGVPSLYNALYYTISFLGTVSAFRFGQYYLKTDEYSPQIDRIANIGLIIVGVGYLLSWFTGSIRSFAQILIMGNNVLLSVVYLFGAIGARKRHYSPATFMLYAFIGTTIFSNLFMLQFFGVIPATVITMNGIHIGYSILGVSITLGLLVRYKMLIEKQKNEETIRRVELERLVKERTRELEQSNQELLAANESVQKQKQEIDAMNQDLYKSHSKLEKGLKEQRKARILLEDLSFEEFSELFKTEQQCYLFLEELKWLEGFTCVKCGEHDYALTQKAFSRRCTSCHYVEVVTVNTLLYRLRMPVNSAFYIVFLVVNNPLITAEDLARSTGVKMNTCWMFKKKVIARIEDVRKERTHGNLRWKQLLLVS